MSDDSITIDELRYEIINCKTKEYREKCLDELQNRLQVRIKELKKKKVDIELRYVKKCHDAISMLEGWEGQEQENKQLKSVLEEIIKRIKKAGYYDLDKACADLEAIKEIALKEIK